MSRTFARRASGIFAGFVLAAALAGCAPEPPATPEESPRPEASEQSVATACGLGIERVDALLANVEDELTEARDQIAAGSIPDIQSLFESLAAELRGLSEGVTNSEVAAALEDLRTAVRGFGEIGSPDSLFGAPAFLASLVSQAQAVNDAGAALQSLCAGDYA